VEPLVRLAAGGIAGAVLLYESYNTESGAFPYAKAAASRIRETLSAVTEEQRLKSLKFRKKRKVNRVVIEDNPAPKVVIFDVRTCLTFEDLNAQLRALVCGEGSGTLSQGSYSVLKCFFSTLLYSTLSLLDRVATLTAVHGVVLYYDVLQRIVLHSAIMQCAVLHPAYLSAPLWSVSPRLVFPYPPPLHCLR
jgi:hypothetical protein